MLPWMEQLDASQAARQWFSESARTAAGMRSAGWKIGSVDLLIKQQNRTLCRQEGSFLDPRN